MSDEAKLVYPQVDILDALGTLKVQTKEKVAHENGEYGKRFQVQLQYHPDATQKGLSLAVELVALHKTNEIRANEEARSRAAGIEAYWAWVEKFGKHMGDLVDMAQAAAKMLPTELDQPGVQPAEGEQPLPLDKPQSEGQKLTTTEKPPAEAADGDSNVVAMQGRKKPGRPPKAEKNAAAAPSDAKPKDSVDAIRETLKKEKPKRAQAGDPNKTTPELLAETSREGDAHIKNLLAEEQAGKDGKLDLSQMRSGGMPEIPKGLDRRTGRIDDVETEGDYSALA